MPIRTLPDSVRVSEVCRGRFAFHRASDSFSVCGASSDPSTRPLDDRTCVSPTFVLFSLSFKNSSNVDQNESLVQQYSTQVTLKQPPPSSVSESEAITYDVLASAALEMCEAGDGGSSNIQTPPAVNGVLGVIKSPSNHLVSRQFEPKIQNAAHQNARQAIAGRLDIFRREKLDSVMTSSYQGNVQSSPSG